MCVSLLSLRNDRFSFFRMRNLIDCLMFLHIVDKNINHTSDINKEVKT